MKKFSILLVISTLVLANACQVKLGTTASKNLAQSLIPKASPTSKPQIVETFGEIEFKSILSGDKSNVRTYDIRVIEDETAFIQLWDDHTGSKTNPTFLPKIDFALKNVIAIFLGDRATTGYKIEINKIEEARNNTTIYLKEVKPAVGSQIKAEVTQPFLIIETKKTNKQYIFDNESLFSNKVTNVTFENIEIGYDISIKDFTKKIARNEKEFSDLYKEHLAEQKNISTIVFPKIDFTKDMVASIFLGQRPKEGYSIKVNNVIKTDTQIIVKAEEIVPPNTAKDITTTPYQFIKMPKSNLPINFDINLFVPSTENLPINIDNSLKLNQVDFKTFMGGENSNIKSSQYLMLKTKEEFKTIWTLHSNSTNAILPEVNFNDFNMIAVFMGEKPTSGYNISVTSIIETLNEIRVFIELKKNDKNVRNIVTNPFDMVLMPKTSKPATFIINNLIN